MLPGAQAQHWGNRSEWGGLHMSQSNGAAVAQAQMVGTTWEGRVQHTLIFERKDFYVRASDI